MIDTGIGVAIALLLNYLLPRSRMERWLHLKPIDQKAASIPGTSEASDTSGAPDTPETAEKSKEDAADC